MYKIIELTEEQSEELNEALEEFDTEHITYRMEGSICLGIQKDGELIAGVNSCVTCFKILYIETLFVQEEYRRTGLGKQLITELEKRAKEMGVNLIRVDTFDWTSILRWGTSLRAGTPARRTAFPSISSSNGFSMS